VQAVHKVCVQPAAAAVIAGMPQRIAALGAGVQVQMHTPPRALRLAQKYIVAPYEALYLAAAIAGRLPKRKPAAVIRRLQVEFQIALVP
jgi:hypothetical protein